jgi:hypothetical protein
MNDAQILVRGARLERTVGAWAARRYVEKRIRNKAHMTLWTICRVMARAERAGL